MHRIYIVINLTVSFHKTVFNCVDMSRSLRACTKVTLFSYLWMINAK